VGLIGDSLTEGRPGVSFFNILKEKYPTITFDNLGKPGETVRSLHTRLNQSKLDTDYDLLFLWIGVNDVYTKMLKVQAQPVTKDHEEFREIFSELIEIVTTSSKRVVAVSPALVGEKINHAANKEIRKLSAIIESISSKHPNVSYLNMQSVFEKHLAKVKTSDYISTSVIRVLMDVLFYKNPTRIDRLSKKRGLHLTLDGIHLNSHGAAMVAKEYATIFEQLLYDNMELLQK